MCENCLHFAGICGRSIQVTKRATVVLLGWNSDTEAHFMGSIHFSVQFSSVQSLSCVRLFATPWITARQASRSITNSRSSLKLMSIESVMPSSHLILCHPLPILPSIPPSREESFPMSHLFAWGGQSIGVSALASVLPMNTQDWSPFLPILLRNSILKEPHVVWLMEWLLTWVFGLFNQYKLKRGQKRNSGMALLGLVKVQKQGKGSLGCCPRRAGVRVGVEQCQAGGLSQAVCSLPWWHCMQGACRALLLLHAPQK